MFFHAAEPVATKTFVTAVFHIRVIFLENSYRPRLIDEGREELVVNPVSSRVVGWKPLPNEDHVAFRQFFYEHMSSLCLGCDLSLLIFIV